MRKILNNKISNVNQRKIGVLLQYAQMGLSIIIQLLYTPVMLRILGSTEYGIYNLAQSTISYLSLLSLGFGASYLRWYSLYKIDDDNEGIKRLNGLYLIVFLIVGFIALIAGLFLTVNVQWFYNETYSIRDVEIARTLMFFLTINLAISFPASVFVSYITSQEHFVFQKIVNMGKTLLSPAVCIIVLYLGYGSIGMVVATTCISILIDIINMYYCLKILHMGLIFRNPSWHLLKDIFAFSIFIAINQVIDQINWQTDKIILGKIVNGTAVAVYAVGSQINTYFTQFSTAVSSTFAPKVNMIVSRNEDDMDDQLTLLFIKVGRIQWYILSLVLMGFIFFGRFFIFKWAGPEYSNSYYVAILLIAPALIPLIQNIGIEIQRAKYKHKFRSIVYLFMAILNIGISIWLASMWGEIGAAVGTTISLLVANGLIINIYYQNSLGINIVRFWKNIGGTLPGFIIPIILGVCINRYYSFHSLIDFILIVLVYSFVYAFSLYFLSFNEEEKSMVNGIIHKVIKK